MPQIDAAEHEEARNGRGQRNADDDDESANQS
jgi:hypothetical protein